MPERPRLGDEHPVTFMVVLFVIVTLAVAAGVVIGLYVAAALFFHSLPSTTITR